MKKSFLIALIFFLCMFAQTAFGETEKDSGGPAVGDVVHGFRLVAADEIDLYQSTLYTYEHEKTGAILCYLANEDTNRCFTICFHTPTSVDTGIPHVFEHATLGGSEKYPDPNLVYSMMYGTYTTYLNAFTDITYTAFQASSLSEDQLVMDMDVLLDGVFHPLILGDEHNMMREAYRYELTDRDEPISLQGVVFSEMLGAVNHNEISSIRLNRLLYPGSHVGSLAGGLPDEILNVTYEELCDFHAEYYTPSNSITVLYGALEIDRYLEMIDTSYFSQYEKTTADLEDTGYHRMEGEVKAEYTFPVSEDSEPETLVYYAIPLEDLTTVEEYILTIDLGILSWPEYSMDQQMIEEFPDAIWSVGTNSTKQGVAIVFSATGVPADQADRFREICDSALNEVLEKGFDPADIRVYADNARYVNAISSEDMDGLGISAGIIDCWNSRGDARQLVEAYDIINHLEVLETDGRCDEVFRKAVESGYGHILLVSEAEIGGREKMEAALEEKLVKMKADMTDEELDALIARTEDYAAWVEASAGESMLSQVTAVTVDTLPEEVVRAYAKVEEEDGLKVISSTLRHTDYITNDLILDASAVPNEYLLPLRLYCLLACRLETENRDRITLGRDIEHAANSLWFSMSTLKDYSDGSWTPVFEITWNTFKDVAAESMELVTDIIDHTSVTDLDYIRSLISTDAMDKRMTYKTGMPYSMAIQEAGRQTSAQNAYMLQYGGINFIEYEERLVGMDDDALNAELQRMMKALSYVLHSDHAILGVAGDREAIGMMKTLVLNYLSGFEPMGEPVDFASVSRDPQGNTAFTIDTSVSFNLEYIPLDQLGIEYNAALNAFTKLAVDQVLIPVFRYENSAYSVFFQIDDKSALVLSYRDPNLAKTFNEIFPSLGESMRDVLREVDQDVLNGYISRAYTSEATPVGVIGRAGLAILGELEHKDYFEEKLKNMRSLKAMTTDVLEAYANILDRLYNDGLKMTVTSTQKLTEAEELFEHVNASFL